MRPFRDKDTYHRVGDARSLAGTMAEDAFVEYMSGRGYTYGVHYTRFGFDRVSTDAALVASVAPEFAHAPDFIQIGGHLWEVQGFGRDRVVRVKVDKLNVLATYWHPSGGRQLRVFLFDHSTGTAYLTTIDDLVVMAADPACADGTLDGKPTREIPVGVLRAHLVTDAFAVAKARGAAR